MRHKKGQQTPAFRRGGRAPGRRPKTRLLALLLALYLLLLAGCGRRTQPAGEGRAQGQTAGAKAGWQELKAARYEPAAPRYADPFMHRKPVYTLPRNLHPPLPNRLYAQRRYTKALPAIWEPEVPWYVRAARTLHSVYIDSPRAPVYKLGMFDLTGDGVPDLMEFSISAWTASCCFYDLAGQKPLPLGGISWPPLEMSEGWVWSKPAACGTAWRFDMPCGHGFEGGAITEMIFPAEDGLHFVRCWEDISVEDMTDWVPYSWTYTVTHWLYRDGECQFSRAEEELHFVPDERLAVLEQEDPERAVRLLPASGMEQVLEGSLYRQLLEEDGWVRAAEPWLTEDDLEPFRGSRLGIDAAGRCRRLYEAWEERQGSG